MTTKKTVLVKVTKEQFNAEKENNSSIEVFELEDSKGNDCGDVMLKRPSAKVIGEWEKSVEKDPMKARRILVNGTLVNRIEEVKEWDTNSDEFYALYKAATEMLPIGKATVKKF